MRLRFCPTTTDIFSILSDEEATVARRTEGMTPHLKASDGEVAVTFMNVDGKDYIKVMEPWEPNACGEYCVKVNDEAFGDLMRNGRCGTRYGGLSAKVNLHLESILEKIF